MAIITATLEDDVFDFSRFSVDYPNGKRYTFHVRDVTNAEYDEMLTKPSAEAISGLNERITVIAQKHLDDEDPKHLDINAEELPHALVANYLRLHTAFLRRLGTSLTA